MNRPPASVSGMALEAIVSRGFTLCASCGKKAKAIWSTRPMSIVDELLLPVVNIDGKFVSRHKLKEVIMKYHCQSCGHMDSKRVFSDARFFYASQPSRDVVAEGICGADCACRASDGLAVGPLGSNATSTMNSPTEKTSPFDHFDNLSPCVTLVEIIEHCNWKCPTCFVTAPHVAQTMRHMAFSQFKNLIQGIIDRKGEIEILQLSGGEPTLHPEFFEIIEWCQSHPSIRVVMINSNGTKFLEGSFAKSFGDSVNREKVHMYLKFNGPNMEAQKNLAGFDASNNETKVLAVLEDLAISTTLAMTVIPQNLQVVWDVASIGLAHSCVRGVNYQPQFYSGRLPVAGESDSVVVDAGHVINSLMYFGGPTVTHKSFYPLPCGDPNCHHIAMFIRQPLTCIGSAVSDEERMKLLGFLGDKINYDQNDLTKCGCETTDFGNLIRGYEKAGRMFRLSIKPFMSFGGSAHNWSCSRTDQCCTSVVGPDGKLSSFCIQYNGLGKPLWPKV